MIYASGDIEKEGLFNVAKLMATAARTAPKSKGIDTILTLIADGGDKDAVTAEMRRLAECQGSFSPFGRDAQNIDDSDYIVFLAVVDKSVGISDCGVCGFENCAASEAAGAPCAFNISDLGTAAGSACAVAAHHWVDNRLMFTAGKAAMNIGLFGEKVRQCYGIPISAKGKNIYFDRK